MEVPGMLKRAMRFTMVELLVVVAIICILMTMLLPALGAARNTVKRISCASNMRQLYTGIALYVNDYDGWMPKSSTISPYYCISINQYLRYSKYTNYLGMDVMAFDKLSGPYVCPGISNVSNSPCWDGGTVAPLSISNYRSTATETPGDEQCGWLAMDSSGNQLLFRKIDKVNNGTVMLCEMNYYTSGWDGGKLNQMMGAKWYGSGSLPTNAARHGFIHHGIGNYLFKDGHVQPYKYVGLGMHLFNSKFIPSK